MAGLRFLTFTSQKKIFDKMTQKWHSGVLLCFGGLINGITSKNQKKIRWKRCFWKTFGNYMWNSFHVFLNFCKVYNDKTRQSWESFIFTGWPFFPSTHLGKNQSLSLKKNSCYSQLQVFSWTSLLFISSSWIAKTRQAYRGLYESLNLVFTTKICSRRILVF